MLVVADSSALVALATCHALELLTALFTDLKVPPAVYDEVTVPTKPQAERLANFLSGRVENVDTINFVLNSELLLARVLLLAGE